MINSNHFHFLLIGIFLILNIGCAPEPPKANNALGSTPPAIQTIPLKVSVFQDESGSMQNNYSRLENSNQLDPLLNAISERGGEVLFGFINARSKTELLKFRVNKLQPPIQKPGQTAADFTKKLIKFKQKQLNKKIDNNVNIKMLEFKRKVDERLSNPQNSGTSDISGSIDLSTLILNEKDDDLEGAYKCVLLISDGINNTPTSLQARFTYDMYLVTNENNSHSLKKYSPIVVSNIDAAIRNIINH